MITQQVLLRDAMRRLNMTRDAFAKRIGIAARARHMAAAGRIAGIPRHAGDGRRFVQEILANAVPRTEQLYAKRTSDG